MVDKLWQDWQILPNFNNKYKYDGIARNQPTASTSDWLSSGCTVASVLDISQLCYTYQPPSNAAIATGDSGAGSNWANWEKSMNSTSTIRTPDAITDDFIKKNGLNATSIRVQENRTATVSQNINAALAQALADVPELPTIPIKNNENPPHVAKNGSGRNEHMTIMNGILFIVFFFGTFFLL